MKVLWFSITPSLYCPNIFYHNGAGWISSLEKIVREKNNIKLGIAFEHDENASCIEKNEVKYYPIKSFRTRLAKFKSRFIYKTEENEIIPVCLKIIEDFKPDVIQVFGSEWCFGLITQYTKIPVVIHMQGSIPPYYNALYPPGYSLFDYLFYYKFRIKKLFNVIKKDLFFAKRAEREIRILRNCQYFIGRTDWDKNLTKLYAPNSIYYYCSEALREEFFNIKTWEPHNRKKIIIVSTISAPIYKGVDVILKTAKLLKENTKYSFEWRIFGLKDIKYHEWKTKIKSGDVNVKVEGIISAEKLYNELINADIFVHPSYIENSPNSVCEAQLLGVPVISTNVGGISSIVQHNENGLLSPANDPFTIASFINKLIQEKEIGIGLGKKARELALQRHDTQKIVNDLLNIYNQIISEDKNNRDKKNLHLNIEYKN